MPLVRRNGLWVPERYADSPHRPAKPTLRSAFLPPPRAKTPRGTFPKRLIREPGCDHPAFWLPVPQRLLVPDHRLLLAGRRTAGQGGRRYASAGSHISVGATAGAVTVTGVSPSTGVVGTQLTITGTGFAVGQSVLCGGLAMDSVNVVSGTSITANIPSGVTTGTPVAVSVAAVTKPNAVTVSATSPVYFDDVEGTGLAPAVNGYVWAASPPNGDATIDTGQAHSGTHSMLLAFSPTKTDIDMNLTLGSTWLDHVWIEFWLYVPSTYYHYNDGGTINNKFCLLWTNSYSVQNDQGFLCGFELNGDPTYGTSSLRAYRTLSSENTGTPYDYAPANCFGQWSNLINNGPSPRPGEWPITPGGGPYSGWYQIRMYVRLSSEKGASDGKLKMWVNGTRVFETNDGTAEMHGYSATHSVGGVIGHARIMGAANSNFPGPMPLWLDDLAIYNSDPVWLP